jgi:hypothetical protein
MGVIKGHIQATEQLLKDIDYLAETIKLLPEGREKYTLEAELRIIRRVAEQYKENSEDMYDQLLDFSMKVVA